MVLTELVEILRKNGVAGAGGAGFPSYAKLDKRADTIILNCAECEPLLKLHRQVLEKYAYELLYTLNEIAEAVEAGSSSAQRLGEVIATHVIPRPHADVEKILPALK